MQKREKRGRQKDILKVYRKEGEKKKRRE